MRELAALAETAGSEVLDGLIQRRSHPDNATYLGKGKAQELRDIVIAEGADTVICDTELAPSQRRALEDVVKVKVIDRTALILDIFAQHAKSKEGKAQVELAQMQYLLPRLRGWGESMSRQAGGQVGGVGLAGLGIQPLAFHRQPHGARQRGGERAAFMYSLIVTAKMNDIDPQAWLADILARMPNLPVSRLPELLPWNWTAAGSARQMAA